MKSILITGSSSGIGKCAALKMAERFHVFAAVRKHEDGETLKKEAGKNLTPIILDVTDEASIARAVATVKNACADDDFFGIVNNAGIVVAGPIEAVPLNELRYQFEVNVIGVLAVTQAFLPLLRKSRGRVVNVGSIAGRMVTPFIGAYCASKFAVEAMSDALRRELSPQGIRVSLIEPGSIKTPIWDRSLKHANTIRAEMRPELEALYKTRLDHFQKLIFKVSTMAIAPERVVAAISCALTSSCPKSRYLVGGEARILALLAQFLPDRIIDFIFAKQI